ncbi:helix-turn-helix domain-containing protein [Asticcacaulis sp.]|uniref:helix-turn-helix domain-containing protein n=1 Tax=Asticcacaulis sp. TaxID=1872648 RepID=UPI003F7CA533
MKPKTTIDQTPDVTSLVDESPWPVPKKPVLPVGERIKERRKALRMTLQELAVKSGLSAPFISQAERNQTVPSLHSLMALSAALDEDVSYFLPLHKATINRGDAPNRLNLSSPVTYVDLSAEFPERLMDAMLIRIPPGYTYPLEKRNGEHFRYVIEGELFATAGDEETILRAGDSMHFDARLPHQIANRSDADALLLFLCTPSLARA